ncbi:pyridoxal-phosphate dependent enzyme [Marinobacterium maritimum]|uniref:Pyridoxal-phosphate dependent enzyme n=2 Tax=Marinobacterium maritimum TaxID=500162 RepID=A0ABN1I436_9GAMM
MPALEQAQKRGETLLSFGGAWSNHLHALAYAGYRLGIKTIGIVRGESEYAANAMLSDAAGWGMELHFVTREEYRRRHEVQYQQSLQSCYGRVRVIPEGGSNAAAVRSVGAIWGLPALIGGDFDYLVTAVGTGGTLAGLIAGRPAGKHVIGVPVLKYDQRLVGDIESLLESVGFCDAGGWSLLPGGHQGGYARLTPELARTLLEVERRFELPLDPVYTGKAFMAMIRRVMQGGIPAGSHVILLHTGGLQGRRGMASRLAALAPDFVGPLAL